MGQRRCRCLFSSGDVVQPAVLQGRAWNLSSVSTLLAGGHLLWLRVREPCGIGLETIVADRVLTPIWHHWVWSSLTSSPHQFEG
jgi:hypothetical protein